MEFCDFVNLILENQWEVHGIEVYKAGELIHKYGDDNDSRYPIYSATKSFTSTAVGIAVGEGKFCIEESIYEYLKEDIPVYLSKRQQEDLKKITIQRLLTMSVKGYPFRPQGNNWLEYSLCYPLPDVNVREFSYSNIQAYLVGVALEKAVGEHLISYLQPRLFEPLEIREPVYGNCPSGHFYGASHMELTVHELSRLGKLYLQDGCYNGNRILSSGWVKEATTSHIYNKEGGYGYFIWKYKNGYRISGKWGQRCFVFPRENVIITYLSHMEDGSERLTEAVERYICQMRES